MNGSVNVLGYSERGILNSLLFEIRYANNGAALFDRLIAKSKFPLTDNKPSAGVATVLVEQSLSDFGTPDVIVLRTSSTGNCAIFVEAKVQTAQSSSWQLCDQFSKFESGLESIAKSSDQDAQKKLKKKLASNIFTQLYQKQCLVSILKDRNFSALKHGVDFPFWSTKPKRKIGENPVVLRAVKLIQRNVDSVFFLALVPDTDVQAANFFCQRLRKVHLRNVPEWDPSHYGFLTWATVKAFCQKNHLEATLDAFAHNQGQIFPENSGQ